MEISLDVYGRRDACRLSSAHGSHISESEALEAHSTYILSSEHHICAQLLVIITGKLEILSRDFLDVFPT